MALYGCMASDVWLWMYGFVENFAANLDVNNGCENFDFI